MKLSYLCVLIELSVFGLSSPATAQENDPGDMRVGVGAGYSSGFLDQAPSGLKLEEHFDFRLVNTERFDLYAGPTLSQTFAGTQYNGDYFNFQIGARLSADIAIVPANRGGFSLAPFVGLGLIVWDGKYFERSTFFHTMLGMELRVIVADGLFAVWARPLSVDFILDGADGTDGTRAWDARFDLLAGAEFRF